MMENQDPTLEQIPCHESPRLAVFFQLPYFDHAALKDSNRDVDLFLAALTRRQSWTQRTEYPLR
jgi:hypothetical protein